jgi:DNA-binding transcriptional LysR family regulator
LQLFAGSRPDEGVAISAGTRPAAALALIETRQAIGILPDYLCGRLLSDRRLRVTPLPRRRDIWLLVQNHLKRGRAARLVIDWIRRCFREAPAL